MAYNQMLLKDLLGDPSPENLAVMQAMLNGGDYQDTGILNPQGQAPMRQAPQMPQQTPQNYLRNQDTGRNIPILDQYGAPSQSQQPGPALDYSSAPVEIGGYGKGYRLKGDASRVVLADGRIVDLGRDTGAERKRQLEDLAIAEKQQKLSGGIGGQDWMKDFDASGRMLLVNRRTGEIKRPTEDIVGAQYSPELAGKISGAKTTGDANAKRTINMGGLNDAIQQAEDLLTGASGKPLPTGSTLGTAYDATAGFFGANPDGAAEAQTLKALGGALTAKMPRMEGPQSDKDVQQYREMSAVVGDSTVPRERRLAALQQVKRLWGKYDQSGGAPAPSAPQAGGASGGWGIQRVK